MYTESRNFQSPGKKILEKTLRHSCIFFVPVLLYNTMKRKRLTPSYCFLLGAVLLFAFSGIWHPLLHHVCVSHEKQELPAIHHASPHTSCAICHGMLQSDETPLFSLSLPHGKPIRNIVFSIRQCRLPVPGEHSPRAPPVF